MEFSSSPDSLEASGRIITAASKNEKQRKREEKTFRKKLKSKTSSRCKFFTLSWYLFMRLRDLCPSRKNWMETTYF